MDEGYIKFKAVWEKTSPLLPSQIQNINHWRQEMYKHQLIGAYEDERLKRIAKAQLEREERARLKKIAYETYFDDKEFINKDTECLDDFIFNDQMNQYDLEKLARLNGIQLEILGGWTELVLALMAELADNGWKGKVGSIRKNERPL